MYAVLRVCLCIQRYIEAPRSKKEATTRVQLLLDPPETKGLRYYARGSALIEFEHVFLHLLNKPSSFPPNCEIQDVNVFLLTNTKRVDSKPPRGEQAGLALRTHSSASDNGSCEVVVL